MRVVAALLGIAVLSAWLREAVPAGLLAAVGNTAPAVVAVVVVVGALVAWGRVRAGTGGATVGHSHRRGHVSGGHAASGWVGRHEAGHYHVAKAVGCTGVKAHANRHGGWVDARWWPKNPVTEIATFRAGRYAVGSSRGCGIDRELERGVLRRVPKADRARVVAEADALSRRLVRRHSGAIRRDGRIISREGYLG